MIVCYFYLGIPTLNSAVMNVCEEQNNPKRKTQGKCSQTQGLWHSPEVLEPGKSLLEPHFSNSGKGKKQHSAGYLRKCEECILNCLSSEFLYED